MDENFTEKQVMIFIKNKGEVKLSEIMVEFGKSNYLTRSMLSKPLVLNQLKEERIRGDSIIKFVEKKSKIINDSVTINPLDKSDPILGIPPNTENINTEISDNESKTGDDSTIIDTSKIFNVPNESKNFHADTSRMLNVPNESKYFHVAGIGTLSQELLSQLFSEGILVMDVEKLVKKMNVETLKIHNDKISFDLVGY